MSARYRCYGLVLDSEVPFGEPCADSITAADWTIRWATSSFRVPDALTFAAEGRNWPAYRASDRWFLMSRETEEAVAIDPENRIVELDLAEHDNERGALMLRGVVSSLLLELMGVPVLHANALMVGGRGVAVAGPRGAGKTTSSAALVAAGARLVSDDVVAVDWRDGRVWMRPGPTGLRLRPPATGVLELFAPPAPTVESLDGRVVLSLPPYADGCVPLASIVVPRPSRSTNDVGVQQLPREAALQALVGSFRVSAFAEPVLARQRLRAIARLSALPVVEVTMPYVERWTPDRSAVLHGALSAWLEERA